MATNPKAEPETADALSAEVKALRADLTELGALVTRIGRQRAAGLKSAATSTVAEGAARGEAAMDVVLAEIESLEEELADATRRRPFAALGLAGLFGFLLGVLMRR